MARRDVQGLAEAYSLIDGLPAAARDELVVELGSIGRELHQAQINDVAKRTGNLASDLTYGVDADKLRLRVGLLSRSKAGRRSRSQKRSDFYGEFYAPFVEYGVAKQIVLVTRRVKKRRIAGNGRTSKREVIYAKPTKSRRRYGNTLNKGTLMGTPYRLRVDAQAARPFVAQPILSQVADNHLSEFWAGALARLGSAA